MKARCGSVTLEQEIASIAAFALSSAGNPSAYYYEVPEEFNFPAMYFPQPEISTSGETFRTYAAKYSWYVNILCETTWEAHERALAVLTALKRARNLVPIIDEEGEETGEKLRLDDPSIKNVDTGVAQVTIEWTSRRPYELTEPTLMQKFKINYEEG